jgi:hypothetical protein
MPGIHDGVAAPVVPDNSELLQFLTFPHTVITLEERGVITSLRPLAREKVSNNAACDVSPASLCRRAFPIPCRTLSGKPRTTAPGGHLQAGGASPAAPPD